MSTIIKLLITALVLNACFQGGRSAWGFYQFQDEVQPVSYTHLTLPTSDLV